MANDVEISFVDKGDFKKQENRYYWSMKHFWEEDSVRATSINNFCRIDISQPTSSVSLSVSLFSLGVHDVPK